MTHRVLAGLLLVSFVLTVVFNAAPPVAAAPNPTCFSSFKCSLIACKTQALPPGGVLGCYNSFGAVIPNCACTLTDTTQYTICSYSGAGSADKCVADTNSIKGCVGTYTPPGGQATYCKNLLYECDPKAPKGPDGQYTACKEISQE